MKGIQRIICFTVMLGVALSVPSFWDEPDFTSNESSEEGQMIGPKETSCQCGWTNKGRIVGGEETKPNEFPLMAGLVYVPDSVLFCGGTIITVHHALTAVHCTQPFKGKKIHLVVGEHDLLSEDNLNEARLHEIDEIFEYEQYNDMTLANDIALVTVKTAIVFSQLIGPACLPTVDTWNLVDKQVKVLGWGYTEDNGDQSPVLMKVNLKVISTPECYQTHAIDIGTPKAKNVLCTYRNERDSCGGDSGGPVIWLDPETNRFTLVGIVSHGKTCGEYPAINTNVTHFLPWIQEKINLSRYSEKTCSKITK